MARRRSVPASTIRGITDPNKNVHGVKARAEMRRQIVSGFLSVEEWGTVTTPKDLDQALATFSTARRVPTDPRHTEASTAAGLIIPPSASIDWVVPPITREDAYQIIDLRGGGTFLHVPLVQRLPSKSAGYPFAPASVIGTVVDHQPAPGPGAPAAGLVLQRVIHGGSSTSCELLLPVDANEQRWYPKAMEGISPRQALVVTLGKQTWGIVVVDLRWDAERRLPYFTIASQPPPGFQLPSLPLPATTRLQRKTGIG